MSQWSNSSMMRNLKIPFYERSSLPKTHEYTRNLARPTNTGPAPYREEGPFAKLLPAGLFGRELGDYNTTLSPAEQIPYFLKADLSVRRLTDVFKYLSLAGRPESARPLHKQVMMRRIITITEQTDLHLTWADTFMFIKPLPRYLLDYRFWESHLSHDIELHELACGFLLSYTWLICYESDYKIAIDNRLIPKTIEWDEWRVFAQEVRCSLNLCDVNKRYRFGELRMNRLNMMYRLTGLNFMRGFYYDYRTYQEFFRQNLAWLLVMFLYVTVVLTAMQVSLATTKLQASKRFQEAAADFSVFAIMFPVIAVALAAVVLVMLLSHNLLATLNTLRKKKIEWSNLKSERGLHSS